MYKDDILAIVGVILYTLLLSACALALELASAWYVYGLWPVSWTAYWVFVVISILIGIIKGCWNAFTN